MVKKIVDYSHINEEKIVRERLFREFMVSGINVLEDFISFKSDLNLEYFSSSGSLDCFYKKTDGFIFELAAWHCTLDRYIWKKNICDDIRKRIKNSETLKILMVGDGLGFDSLYLYQNLSSAKVEYFEFEDSKSFKFAKNMFKDYNANIKQIGHLKDIKKNYYDIVVCLDVLEHLKDPFQLINDLFEYLHGSGVAYVSEAFGAVEVMRPTHLKSNLKYVGEIEKMFNKNMFYLAKLLFPRIYVFTKNRHERMNFIMHNKIRIKNYLIKIYFKFKYKPINFEKINDEIEILKKDVYGMLHG